MFKKKKLSFLKNRRSNSRKFESVKSLRVRYPSFGFIYKKKKKGKRKIDRRK